MLALNMTPAKLRQRLQETEGRVDAHEFVEALAYVRDDGRE